MRTVIFTFAGEPTEGDLLMVWAKSSRGGQSTAKCVIGDPATPDITISGTNIRRNFKKAQTFNNVAQVLEGEINSMSSEWAPGSGDFRAVAKGNKLTVMASNVMNDVSFGFDVEGAQTETCEVEVLG